MGYNYLIEKHEADHQRVPNRVMWQTESYAKDTYRNWSLVHDMRVKILMWKYILNILKYACI